MKILVVDDDDVSRLALAGVLRTLESAEIVEANDGQQAWELLEQGLRPAICCSDVRMPTLGGIQLMERCRAHPILASLPFVLITSASDRETVEAGVRGGTSGYILKPFNGTETRATVARVVRERRAKAAEHPYATRGRLQVGHLKLRELLETLRGGIAKEADALGEEAAPSAVLDALSKVHTACVTLGLWQSERLLKNFLAARPAPPMARAALREVGTQVELQLAMVQALWPIAAPASPAATPAPATPASAAPAAAEESAQPAAEATAEAQP